VPSGAYDLRQQDALTAYISWETFLANQARLAASHTAGGERPAREGSALCQGIVSGGSCGRTMGTHYQRGTIGYKCSRSRLEPLNTPGCRDLKADVVDQLVTSRLLQALAPEQIALALAATDEVQERRTRANRALELRVERARYEAGRAERVFTPASPTTASSPAASRPAGRANSANSKTPRPNSPSTPCPPPNPRAEQIEALARDLPALWGSAGDRAPASATPSSGPPFPRPHWT
jgi:hypothetical protein